MQQWKDSCCVDQGSHEHCKGLGEEPGLSRLFQCSSNSLPVLLYCIHRPQFHSPCVYCIQGWLQNVTFAFPVQVAVSHTCEKLRGSSILWNLGEIISACALPFGSRLIFSIRKYKQFFYTVLINEHLFLLRIYWALSSLKNSLFVHLSSLCLPVFFHLKPNIFSSLLGFSTHYFSYTTAAPRLLKEISSQLLFIWSSCKEVLLWSVIHLSSYYWEIIHLYYLRLE